MNLSRNIIIGIVLAALISVSGIVVLFIITYTEPLPDLGVASNFTLVNEENQTVTLETYENKVLLIDFIYTNCPDPEFCPLSSSKMQQVQDNLLAKGYTSEDFHLLSISFDWQYDGYEDMKNYSIRYNANPEVWSFLSGTQEQINDTTTAYGVFAMPGINTTLLVHSMVLTIVDSTDHIRATHEYNEWTVSTVTNQAIQLIKEKQESSE